MQRLSIALLFLCLSSSNFVFAEDELSESGWSWKCSARYQVFCYNNGTPANTCESGTVTHLNSPSKSACLKNIGAQAAEIGASQLASLDWKGYTVIYEESYWRIVQKSAIGK